MEVEKGYQPAIQSEGGVATGVPMGMSMKQGHVICGGCCDSRRAVIILNIVMLTLTALLMVTIFASIELLQSINPNDINDDEQKEEIEEEQAAISSGGGTYFFVILLIAACFYGLGIFAGVEFNYRATATVFVWHCLGTIGHVINFNPIALAVSVFSIYAHWIFMKEINSGIMSPETYERERQSCCCV